MRLLRFAPLFLAVSFASFPTFSQAAVVLNELRVDQSGADDDEYVELYSSIGMSLDGISFVILQDNGVIDGLVDLAGQVIGANDPFLIGETAILPASGAAPDLVADLNLENGENSSYLLVQGFTSSVGTDLDADDDGVFDAALPWTSLLDGVALIDDEATILEPGGTEDINYASVLGINQVGPDGPFYPGHVYASVDGGGIDTVGAFDASSSIPTNTPGLLNVTAIPEPSFAAVLGIGCCVLGCRRRRRQA